MREFELKNACFDGLPSNPDLLWPEQNTSHTSLKVYMTYEVLKLSYHVMLHDGSGYCPYEGRRLKGWPVTVLSRCRVVDGGSPNAERGSCVFLSCECAQPALPAGCRVLELDPATNVGAELL